MSVPVVPGDTTGNPRASVEIRTVSGRCPRCERWTWQTPCPGVYGKIIHLGS